MNQTNLYKLTSFGERLLGSIDAEQRIHKGDDGEVVGQVVDNRILLYTQHGERELGTFSETGLIHSHGLFEGGTLGWVDPDGVVIRAGLILGEEEIGRVEGDQRTAGAAALLLLFLVQDQEEEKRLAR